MFSEFRFARLRHLGVLVALVVGAFAFTASAQATSCNPLSSSTCLAPFPSDYWSVADGGSPTGIRLNVSNDVLRSPVLNALPAADGITPAGIFNGSSGFSAAAGAVFEFNGVPDPSSLPTDGGNAAVAFDLDTGQRVPVHAFVSDYAKGLFALGGKTNVVQVFPRVRWAYGHRILVAITNQLAIANYNYPNFNDLADRHTTGSPEADYADDVEAALTGSGLDSDSVRTATVFTVRARSEFEDPAQDLLDRTLSDPHPVRNLKMLYDPVNPYIGGVVTGELRTNNYRRGGIKDVDYSGATISHHWIPFRLTLPRSSASRKAPVIIYSHGLSVFKESDIVTSSSNAKLGMATMSIDFPNHGARSLADGGNLLQNLSPSKIANQLGMLNQAMFDTASAYRALQTSLAGVDYLAKPSLFNWYGFRSDGKGDIDAARISHQGTSLGGVLGANFAAMVPTLDGAVYHVTGNGITHILSQSILFPGIFSNLIPTAANGTEGVVLLSAIQQSVDGADAINSIDYMRNPRPGQNKKPLLILAGANDSIVPNPSTVATANLVDLPLVGPQRFPVPGGRVEADYDPDGYGLRQYAPLTDPLPIDLLAGATAHLAFIRPAAIADQERFTAQYIAP